MANIDIVADLDEITEEDWHRLRLTGLGGSDAGVVAGLSTYRSPYDLWVEKVRGDVPDPSDEKEYQRWGRLLEDPIAEEFATRTGLEVHAFRRMIRSQEHPFMFANVDRLVGSVGKLDGVLEIKTTRFGEQWERDGEVVVPLAYAAQGQHYLAVLDLDVVHFACLVGGQKLVIAEVERNDALIDDLIAIEADFWGLVERNEPPPLDGTESTRRALQRRWAPDPDKTVKLDKIDEMAGTLSRRDALSEQIKSLQGTRDDLDATIMAALGDAEVGTIGGKPVVTWKGSERHTLDQKAFKAAHPALAAEFERTTQVRTLRFPTAKGE